MKINERVITTMGVRLRGTVIAPTTTRTDGSYRAPYGTDRRIAYVQWDDGTIGWIHTAHIRMDKAQ